MYKPSSDAEKGDNGKQIGRKVFGSKYVGKIEDF